MDLPTLLSGPIIRRTDETRVTIWAATSTKVNIEAKLCCLGDHHHTSLSTRTKTETVQIGEKLYIHLLTVIPSEGSFPTNQLLGYNLLFQRNSTTFDLSSLNLLNPQNPHSIIYGDLDLPSFYINTDQRSNILYGSCRKPHSDGYDALASADLKIEENYKSITERPSSLFLMGDQIYADDIPDPLSQFIKRLGRELIGKDENLTKLDERLSLEPFKTSINQTNGRQFIMEHFAKFTSNNATNHLISLGEYAAMYLLSFGPQLWDLAKEFGVFKSFEEINDFETFYYIYPKETKKYKKEREKYHSRYNEQLQRVYQFHASLFHVQRALANIPTYMIFDDHDITDDWNLTIDWKKDVWNAPLGRHVVANGLAAYWAFQGWGNEPEQFTHLFKTKLSHYFNTFNLDSSSYTDFVNLLWTFNDWFFIAPTTPKTIFLDTRTMRRYDPKPKPTSIGTIIEENIRSPQLISEEGWEQINNKLRKADWQSGTKLIIVSPTPLYGIGLIETVLHKYVYPLRTLGLPVHSLIDLEAWKYNGKGFNSFINWITNWDPSDCFILSGDVHYASSARSSIEFENGQRSNIYQFTSSPLCNMSFTGLWGSLLKKTVRLNTRKRKGRDILRYCDQDNTIISEDDQPPLPPKYKWRESIQYLKTEDNKIMITDNNLGHLRINHKSVKNTLLQYYGVCKQEKPYNTQTLDGQ